MSAPRLGRYELVRKIAAGGMAEIFLARQWGAGGFFRDVVIKRLFKHLAEHPRQLRMFQDEGRLLAALSHPNIPQVFDLGFADGHWYIAMEYVDGWNVADVWRQGAKTGQTMPMQVALGIVMQACEALHHAHERADRARRPLRIVHRDVTPQNLMLTRDGVVKLMDFGVAQTTARKDTEAGAVRGTFSYMAPEQVRAKPLDKRADVFALGVIMYELTTGSRLFRGSDVQIMTQVVEQDVAPPSTRIADYPSDLEDIVLGALQRDRGRRTPSAAHIAWKLEELAQRNGFLVGPRAVARYVSQVIPAEPILEEDLALVRPDATPPHEIAAEIDAAPVLESETVQELVDDEGLLEDLQLLSLPPDADEGALDDEGMPAPIAFDGAEDIDLDDDDGERVTTPSDPPRRDDATPEAMGLADLLATEPVSTRPPRPSYLPPGVVPLTAAEVENEEEQRPVVLLGSPKKKSTPSMSPSGRDYVRELEKRLARDDDDHR
ncbi:serine/threonine protein kinase [Sandaracinus amylolyticus]|uniref:serine/threonine protein kinase n=1 Tax=Sandaracinus amylolyticus TaxID=927083 RepID=UPI001F244D77|nr:serine/threonine-protein kinase [Sandaracinus amylolyticus]UJR79040.1 Serine/threonine protein kinase [Sandaracinus amylolyticus]